jgi:hypothetical protein
MWLARALSISVRLCDTKLCDTKGKNARASEFFCYEQEDAPDATFLSSIGFQQWRNVVRFDSVVVLEAERTSPLLVEANDFERRTIVALTAQTSEGFADLQTRHVGP